MRLFISYSHQDKLYCQQIVDILDVHEIWHDHRVIVGQRWWDEITRQISLCDGIIYLMSHYSVNSEYCQRELVIAEQLGKHIFPVLIHASAKVPPSLREIQYADLSRGLDANGVKMLLNAIYVAERDATLDAPESPASSAITITPSIDYTALIEQARRAMEAGNYDRAGFLLRQVDNDPEASRVVDVQLLLRKTDAALERQAYEREAEREYRPIVMLVKRQYTFQVGRKAFIEYLNYYPDYDPENLAALCLPQDVPLNEWREIPDGEMLVEPEPQLPNGEVEYLRMAKYPITNRQFQLFVDAPDGYRREKWWAFTPDALAWHREHPRPSPSGTTGDDNPRTNICRYEATAFCSWFMDKTGVKITLPNQHQFMLTAHTGNSTAGLNWIDEDDEGDKTEPYKPARV